MQLRKLICLFLAVVMLSALAVGCASDPNATPDGETTTEADGTTADQGPAETQDPNYDENGYWKDDLPADLNFDTTIGILYWSDVEKPEFEIEEITGDLVNDALFRRNEAVSNRLGVTFDWIGVPGNFKNQDAFVKTATTGAQDATFDIIASYSMVGATLMMEGVTQNLLELDGDYLNFEQPWWPDSLIEACTVNDKLYFCSGDISTNMLHFMYAVFFNREIQQNLQLDDPYDLVKNNAWTTDKMFEMAENVYSDLDMDQTKSTGDRYGFITAEIHVDAFYCAAGLKYLELKDDFLVVSDDLTSQKASDLVDSLRAKLHTTDDVYLGATGSIFKENTVLFTLDRAYMAENHLREIEFSYGILPVPKYNTEQEDYVTILGFPYSMYSVTKTSQNVESGAVSAVLECMASESFRQVTPALFETTMKVKYNSDELYAAETSQMYDTIRQSVYFDPGRIFTTPLNNLTYSLFRTEVYKNLGTWSSSLKISGRTLGNLLNAVNDAYQ